MRIQTGRRRGTPGEKQMEKSKARTDKVRGDLWGYSALGPDSGTKVPT